MFEDSDHRISQIDVSVKCKARNANSVVMNISIVGHYSIQPVSQDDILTKDFNRITFKRVSYERTSATRGYWSALKISDISKTPPSFIFICSSKQMSVPDLTSLLILVIVVVTNEHSSSSSSLISTISEV